VNVVAAMDFQVGLCSPTVNMFILLRSDLIKQLKMYVQCTSLHILMRADVLVVSRTVSELSQFIVPISDTLRFRATLWRLRDNVRCSSWAHWKARSGLLININ